MTKPPGKPVPWSVFKERFRQSFGFDCDCMNALERQLAKQLDWGDWHQLRGWENMTDAEILKNLEDLQPIQGEVHVVSDGCYRDGFSPFRCPGESLAERSEAHQDWAGTPLIDCDLLIINLVRRRIWAFHHEGVYAVLDFEDPASPERGTLWNSSNACIARTRYANLIGFESQERRSYSSLLEGIVYAANFVRGYDAASGMVLIELRMKDFDIILQCSEDGFFLQFFSKGNFEEGWHTLHSTTRQSGSVQAKSDVCEPVEACHEDDPELKETHFRVTGVEGAWVSLEFLVTKDEVLSGLDDLQVYCKTAQWPSAGSWRNLGFL